MAYSIAQFLVHCFYRICFRYEVVGTEHVPSKGPVLLCSNHISNWDPPIVGLCTTRFTYFMAKQELLKIPILSRLIAWLGAIPIKRGVADRAAIRRITELLEQDKVVIMFPEGTRSKTGELGKAFTGAGFLALRSQCTVIPVVIHGPFKLFRKVRISVGPAVDLSDLIGQRAKNGAQIATDRIMEHMQRLLDSAKHQ